MEGEAQPLPAMTLDEFLGWSERQEEPYEFVDGRPVPLFPSETDPDGADVAGSFDHHVIQLTLGVIVRTHAPAGARVAAAASVRVATGKARVPDVLMTTASSEPNVFLAPEPVLIVEVISPTTGNVDQGDKLSEYKGLASVREIWLVHGTRRAAIIWSRREGGWFVADVIGRGSFKSELLGTSIALDDVYAGTEL